MDTITPARIPSRRIRRTYGRHLARLHRRKEVREGRKATRGTAFVPMYNDPRYEAGARLATALGGLEEENGKRNILRDRVFKKARALRAKRESPFAAAEQSARRHAESLAKILVAEATQSAILDIPIGVPEGTDIRVFKKARALRAK